MISRRKEDSFLAPDLTPLIDVTFLLLIFFLVSSVFKKEQQVLKLTLPQSLSGIKASPKNKLSIHISALGIIAFNGKAVSSGKELEPDFLKLPPSSSFKISADKNTAYEKVIEVLDILKKNNFHQVSLVTTKGKKI